MKIDLDHLHHWMCAIRNSDDPKRTLDAFWQGQVNSKLWLIENVKPFIENPVTIDIHGGWVGVLSSLLFQSDLPIKSIRSIDIDPSCQSIATTMNKVEEMQGRFEAVTADMCSFQTDADVIINTSCEHISQRNYDYWLSKMNSNTLLILQSNNYEIPEHVRISSSLEDFIKQSGNVSIKWKGELTLPLYKRFMIVATKN